MRNILLEISANDPATSTTTVLRACSAHAGPDGTYLDGKEWLPVIVSGPQFEISYWSDGQPNALNISYGSIGFLISADTGSNVWPKYSFEGQTATVWVGEFGDAFTAYRKIWTGALGPLDRNSDTMGTLPLLGPEAALNKPVLSDTYGGTGGADGTSSLMGTYKPYAIGACTNIAPVLIDPAKWVYHAHGYGACPINGVYESAYPVDIVATVSTYAQLIALTIPAGKAAVAPAVGMFRLANEPTGKISADVGASSTVGATVSALMQKVGLSAARIDASVTNTTRAYSLYVTSQEQAITLVRDAAFAGGRYLIADGAGKFFLAPFVSTKTPTTLTADRSTLPLIQPDKITQETPASPAYKVRIGHTRVWSTHSTNEISPALATLAADQAALDARAQAAQDAADQAQADANLALARYNAMVADGILDRPEKIGLVREFEAITAERAGLISTASGLGVSTTAYSTAYSELSTYLTGLTPAYDDATQDTPIDGATFTAKFNGYRTAKQALVNASANAAATRANWTSVASRPTNLTALNSAEGTKLTGIETGATKGAPAGTTVGGKEASTVIDALTTAQGELIKSRQLQADIATANQTASDLQTTYGSTANAAASASAAQTAATNAQTAADNADTARQQAQSANTAAGAAKTAAETSRTQAQTAASDSSASKTAAETAKTASETARTQAQTAKADAETAFANSTTARTAAESAKTAAETARTQAQTSATNAGNSATAAAGSASTASTKATDAGNSATAAAASNVSATATYNAIQATQANQPILPSDFSDGLIQWSSSRVGNPATPQPVTGFSIVDDDADFGRACEMTWGGAGSNILTRGCLPATPGRYYEVRARFKVVAGDGAYAFNLMISEMGATFAGTATAYRGTTSNPVTSGNVVEMVAIFTDPSSSAAGITVPVARWTADARNMRFGLRNNASETGMTVRVHSIRVSDVTDRLAAEQSASAASTSASSAASSATDAGTSATSASTSAITATTKAGQASTSANNAATSETNAAGSASAAQSSATTAAGSATTAGQKADAASTSATTAATKANEASQSATSASTSATTATTKAGQASTSATNAAASETNANSSKNAAATSATNAANSANSAGDSATAAATSATTASTKADEAGTSADTAAAQAIYASSRATGNFVAKSTFEDGALGLWQGSVTVINDAVTALGTTKALRCRQRDNFEGTGFIPLSATNARVFRISGYARCGSSTAYGVNVGINGQDSASTDSWIFGVAKAAGATAWAAFNFTIAVPASVVRFRPFVQSNNDGTGSVHDARVVNLTIEDITESTAAAGSATAAAGSASTAGTSATNASTSANSATTSANTATTKAGEASTSASNAATSESNALGSKNAAATSATNAANSANAAGGSATAAAGSATNAGTSATNAGNSASAAAASNVSATSSAVDARLSVADSLPYDFSSDGKYWQWGYNGVPSALTPITANSTFSFVDIAEVGRVIQVIRTTAQIPLAPIGWMKVQAGRRYRLSATVRCTNAAGRAIQLWSIGLPTGGTSTGNTSITATLTAQNQWYSPTYEVTGDDLIAGGSAYLRPMVWATANTTTLQLATMRVEDITESANANISAIAAATSASAAGTSATNAGNSANSASTSANTATTKAGEASGSASSAATSASNASSASTNAGNSATAANGSNVSATLSAASLMPSDFQQDGKFWQQGFGGLPANLTPISANSTFSFVTNSDVGRALRATSSSQVDVGNIGMLPLSANRVYRLTARVRQLSGSVFAQLQLYRIGVTATGGTTANGTVTSPSTLTFTALNTWVDMSGTVTGGTVNAMIAAGANNIRALLRLVAPSSSVTVEYLYIRIEDITESDSAAGSASAAANSASSASASQTAAGSSASSAQGSATTAATQAGNAATSANNASTSASNAAGSANTASTQATNASNSANAASGSASSASTSANTASTKATEAANSADTAYSQSIYAGSRAAGNFVAKPTFEDSAIGPWQGSVSTVADAVSALGTTRALRSQNRDATETDFIPLTANNVRTFRVSGYAKCGSSSAYGVNCGIHGMTTANAHSFIFLPARAAGQTSWAAFNFNISIPANIAKFRAFIQSNNDAGQPGSVHDARVVGLTIEDITDSTAAAGSASAAASSASSASTSAGNAGSSASSASNSANTASTKASEASSSASAAAGSASTATGAASTATTQANLTATYSTGGGNLLTNTDFMVDTSGWNSGGNSSANMSVGINGGGNEWHPEFANAIHLYQQNNNSGQNYEWTQTITVEPNHWYDTSVLVAAHRCQIQVYLQFINASNTAISTPSSGSITPSSGGTNPGNWTQIGFKGQAPADAVKATLYLRKWGTLSGNTDSWAWFMRPQVRETFANAPSPCVYSPGNGGAVAATLNASVSTQATAIATANSTLATLNSTVSAQGVTISNTSQALNTTNNNVATALGRAAVKVDVGGRVTGWETNNNGVTGNFKIHADNFSIEKPGGGARTEFSNGCWRVYDENGVLRVRLGNLS